MHRIAEIPSSITRKRRLTFTGLNLLLLGLGVVPMAYLLSRPAWNGFRIMFLVIFAALLAQIILGFILAVTGYWLLKRQRDPLRINNTLPSDWQPKDLAATAVVMPIANEDVGRVFRGLRVMYESLQKTGCAQAFDFFVLSD